MIAWSLVAAFFAALAAAAWQPATGVVRGRVVEVSSVSRRRVTPWVAPLGAGLAGVLVVEGALGLVVGSALAFVVHQQRRRSGAEPDRVVAATRALELPIAVEVLASCLAVGASQEQALRAVAGGLGGSLADDFSRVAGALGVGADVAEAWSLVPSNDLRSLAAVLSRAHVTGAPVAPQLWSLADQHRQLARVVAMDAAGARGVRAPGARGRGVVAGGFSQLTRAP
ncbi:MAG: type II secretion system F family protein, partial [Actinomycetia bacterium]|nr:type II secretion system F family protein [Actinomycetes bacterium]